MTRREDGSPLGDGALLRSLEVLGAGAGGTDPLFSARLSFITALHGPERRADSYRDRVFLARYGRMDPRMWDKVTVRERKRYVHYLSELLRAENAAAKATEDL